MDELYSKIFVVIFVYELQKSEGDTYKCGLILYEHSMYIKLWLTSIVHIYTIWVHT